MQLFYFTPAQQFFGTTAIQGNVYRVYDTEAEKLTTIFPNREPLIQEVEYGNFVTRNSLEKLPLADEKTIMRLKSIVKDL